jgi:hypothetical protein
MSEKMWMLQLKHFDQHDVLFVVLIERCLNVPIVLISNSLRIT